METEDLTESKHEEDQDLVGKVFFFRYGKAFQSNTDLMSINLFVELRK